jgi:hypothetical protein
VTFHQRKKLLRHLRNDEIDQSITVNEADNAELVSAGGELVTHQEKNDKVETHRVNERG